MGVRQVNLLEMVFAGPGGSRYVVTAEDRAAACIIDLDGAGAGDELQRQRSRHPGRPLLLTAVHRPPEPVVGRDLFLPKPIRVDALVQSVDAVLARLVGTAVAEPSVAEPSVAEPSVEESSGEESFPDHPSAEESSGEQLSPEQSSVQPPSLAEGMPGTARGQVPAEQLRGRHLAGSGRIVGLPSPSPSPDLAGPAPQGVAGHRRARVLPLPTPPSPAATPGSRIDSYEPARYLQGLVVRARDEALRRGQAVHLEGPWPTITLLPGCATAVVPGGAAALRPYGPQYDLPSHARPTFTPAPMFSPHHPDAVDLEALIWELALAASGGRIPEGVPVDTLCALQDWPNFTRLTPSPGAMSIAALWTHQPATLTDTARLLQVPLREVCAFYSAAHALDLVAVVPAAATSPSPPPTVHPSPRRGLLRRVFDKLHGQGAGVRPD